MRISAPQIALMSLMACIAGADSVLDELQIHRPLVVCPLIGWVLGDLRVGVIVGGALEMVVLGWMNVGAAVAPDAALASVVATILVIAGGQNVSTGIALAIPVAALGQILTIVTRTAAVTLQHLADRSAESGDLAAIDRLHVGALLLQMLRVAVSSLVAALLLNTGAVQSILEMIPELLSDGLNVAGNLMMMVGYATVVNMMWTGYLIPFFYLGFIASAFSGLNITALGAMGAILATLYVQLSHRSPPDQLTSSAVLTGKMEDDELD